MKCEQIEDIVMDAVQRGMVNVISTDASGFDSNCHRELKEIVCSPIEEAFMDAVEDMIMNGRFYTHMDEGLKRKLAKGLREAYLRRDFELIIPAPGIDLSYPLTQR